MNKPTEYETEPRFPVSMVARIAVAATTLLFIGWWFSPAITQTVIENDLRGYAATVRGSGLSVEDKVAFVLMLLCKYMDKQIEAQMKYIQRLQLAYARQQEKQRQENLARVNGTSAADGANGSAPADGAEDANGTQVYGQVSAQTIDTEVLKLKRLVDKRGQLFDIMRQIIDKYNQTAKSIIDSIGR